MPDVAKRRAGDEVYLPTAEALAFRWLFRRDLNKMGPAVASQLGS
jgi:hypothetical protein